MLPLPAISDEDISWVCGVMGLPLTAFSGDDGNDPRLNVIKTLTSFDVEACPGSGKTTLLVAKLAILSKNWPSRSRGLCVLSHTNAARDEIVNRLGGSATSRSLLKYPHYVGTIHSFVNEFLALPYLRSIGNPVVAIDSEIATSRRWRRLSTGARYAIENKNPHIDCISSCTYGNPDYSGGRLDGLKMGQHTPTYADLKRVCEATSKEGYFCFDEMFVWARALLAQQPEVAADIRARFPILLMDEVQDNSEEQASLLHAIFIAGAHPVLRQRFGDSNQAIYDSAYGEGAQTDPFPGPGKIDLPNSFRFGQKIADLSDPLAVVPQGLIGLAGAGFQPTIFLFDDASMRSVLPEYGRLLMEVFHPAENSAASFVAVSGVHTGDGEDHLPRRLGHYAPSYDASLARRAALPTTMSQYIRAGLKEALITGHTGPLVQNVSTGLLRLADIAGTPLTPSSGRNAHQRISRTLEELARPQAYQALQDYLIRNASRLTEEFWNTRLSKLVCRVVQDLSDQDPTTAASDFLAWDQPIADDAALLDAPANTYRYEKDGRSLHIRLGSIHSVKGETHDATLVLESFMRDHHLRALKAWLVGTKSGAGKASEVLKKRLRLHYVGMTRPRTLLCLAMRADSLEAADLDALEQRGWSIVTCPPFVAPEAGTHAE
jgi:superfamily I DNA/RNA helicase